MAARTRSRCAGVQIWLVLAKEMGKASTITHLMPVVIVSLTLMLQDNVDT